MNIDTLSPIELRTTNGTRLLGANREPLTLSQRDFYLTLVGEPEFTRGLRGRTAARFQAEGKAAVERAFPDGEPTSPRVDLLDLVATALARTAEATTISIYVNGTEFGPAVQWCFVGFMNALADAVSATAHAASSNSVADAAQQPS